MLISISESVINTVHNKVDEHTWSTINELGITAKKKTRRGCRSGRNKQRKISSIASNRLPVPNSQTSRPSINHSNLVPIPINHNPKNAIKNVDLNKTYRKTSKQHAETKIVTWNTRSMNNKTSEICDFVTERDIDVLAIQETWLYGNEKDDCTLADVNYTLPNFDFVQSPRRSRKGGGVAFVVKKGYSTVVNEAAVYQSFEHMDVTITQRSSSIRIFNIYRPTPSKINKATQSDFLEDFSAFLETAASIPSEIVILGDFNIHVNDADDNFARSFQGLLDAVGLRQHVTTATHKSGNTLDLLISRSTSNVITGMAEVMPRSISDHSPVRCSVNLHPPRAPRKIMKYHKIRQINIDDLKSDIESSALYTDPASNLEERVKQYESVMRELLDKHAPLVEKTVIIRPQSPWYTDDLRHEKQKKRQAERKVMKSKLEIDRQMYVQRCKSYKTMLETAKRDYHRTKISESDSKELFRVVDKLCNPITEPPLPDHDSN